MPTWLVLPTLAQTLLATALCFVPLFDLLGYEFCLAIGLAAAMLTPAMGLAAAAHARSAAAALARAAGGAALHLVPALVIISLNASRVRNCNYGAGLQFFALLPALTSLYGACLGAMVGRLCQAAGRAGRAVLVTGAVVCSLCYSLWRLYDEPPIFVFNHLWGYFAGSLYDERIAVDARLLGFRAGTALRVLALAATAVVWERWPRLGGRRVVAVVLAAWASCSLYERLAGPALGFRVGRAELAAALPQTVRRPGITVHLPATVDAATARRIGDDHAFRLAGTTAALGATPLQPIASYVYPDAATKARLMGGRGTMVAKPWLREVHLHGTGVPHPLLAHELAHAVAADFGSRLLGVSARAGVWVNMGLVEGLAEAVAPDDEALTLHVWARAMRDLDLAPDMVRILGPAGFWGEAPQRAYTVAGSFVRYLLATYGPTPLRAAYPAGDFEAAYRRPLAALVADWQHFLDGVAVSPREAHIAAERFRPASIFARVCAHEVANLEARAAAAPPAEALALRRQICAHLGDAPAARLELALALRGAGDLDAFYHEAEALLATGELGEVQRGRLLAAQAEALFGQGRRGEAMAVAREVRAGRLGLAAERLGWVRLWAMERGGERAEALLAILAGRTGQVAAALTLDRSARVEGAEPTYGYLLGRQLLAADDDVLAGEALVAAGPHPFRPIEAERLRLLGDIRRRRGDTTAAAASYLAYGEAAPTSGGAAQAEDLLARLAWEDAQRPE